MFDHMRWISSEICLKFLKWFCLLQQRSSTLRHFSTISTSGAEMLLASFYTENTAFTSLKAYTSRIFELSATENSRI